MAHHIIYYKPNENGEFSRTAVDHCKGRVGCRREVLFLLYTADVTVIAQQHGFLAHCYADDTRIYFHDKAVDTRLPRLKECISEIDFWMSSNRLCLNADKTQFISLGTRQQLVKA